jgi:hypothetical protein
MAIVLHVLQANNFQLSSTDSPHQVNHRPDKLVVPLSFISKTFVLTLTYKTRCSHLMLMSNLSWWHGGNTE